MVKTQRETARSIGFKQDPDLQIYYIPPGVYQSSASFSRTVCFFNQGFIPALYNSNKGVYNGGKRGLMQIPFQLLRVIFPLHWDIFYSQSLYLCLQNFLKGSLNMKLELLNLNKSFGEHRVLKDISISADDFSSLVFIGPSGGGENNSFKDPCRS